MNRTTVHTFVFVTKNRMQTGRADNTQVCVCMCVCKYVWADAHRTGGPDMPLLGYGQRLECIHSKMTLNNPE